MLLSNTVFDFQDPIYFQCYGDLLPRTDIFLYVSRQYCHLFITESSLIKTFILIYHLNYPNHAEKPNDLVLDL